MREVLAVDLCSGVGGWACAARGLPVRFVAAADLAADCLETWALNHGTAHPGCALLECDLSTPGGVAAVLDACRGVKIDLVLGGIPCEAVSCARGNRPVKAGELGGLHALVDQVFGLASPNGLAPRWWCYEDVEGIKRHLPPPILAGPYAVRKIDASLYGPQRRQRVFIGRFPWPVAPPEPGPRTLGEVLRPGPYRTLTQVGKYERSRSKWYGGGGGKKVRVQEADEPGATVVSAAGGRSNERGILTPLARVLGAQVRAGEACPTVADFNGRHERGALVPVDGEAGPREVLVGDGMVRVLEWQEAALLQGFPPDFVFAASWSRTWKLLAQAIPIQVGKCVLKAVVAEWEGGADA